MWVGDLESDGLLDTITKLWCFCVKKYKKDKIILFTKVENLTEDFIKTQESKHNIEWKSLSDLRVWLENELDTLCIHNLFGFDLEALRLTGYIDSYDIKPESINGKPKRLIDTLSMSRALYPDRPLPKGCPAKVYNEVTGKLDSVGSHGLAAWGYRVANMKPKIDDWRNQPLDTYCERVIEDVIINELALTKMIEESKRVARGDNKPKIGLPSGWKDALRINNKSDYLMCKGERDGILFDEKAAIKLRDQIDQMMDDIAADVESQLPLRELPISQRADFPQNPFKKDGDISSSGYNWLKRLGYQINDEAFNLLVPPAKPYKANGELSAHGDNFCIKNGIDGTDQEKKEFIKSCQRKLEQIKPLKDEDYKRAVKDLKNKVEPDWKEPMKISNQDDIKLYLFRDQSWYPTLWNTKDITRDDNKRAVPEDIQDEKIEEYITKYSESPYKTLIEEEMGIKFDWPSRKLKRELRRKARFLVTTPKLKDERGELCPSLESLQGEMAKKIVKWLSLRNRRSVIQSKDEKKQTGWLNNPRLKVDGRIGQGFSGVTNTNRYKHRTIVNLPKASPDVLLGKEMRSLFIAPKDHYILGYDGSNLEQFVAGCYAWIFDKGEYLKSLEGDSHTTNAIAYTEAAGREVSRGEGKGVTYACLPTDNTDVLTKSGWKKHKDLSYTDEVLTYSEIKDQYEWNNIQHIHHFKDKEVIDLRNNHIGFESTPDHRWLCKKRKMKGSKYTKVIRYFSTEYVQTQDLNTECNIRNNSLYFNDSCTITDHEAELVGWLLADGYYSWSNKDEITSSSFGKRKGLVMNICQSVNKYQKELEECLLANEIRYTVHDKKDVINKDNPVSSYLIKAEDARNFLDRVVGIRDNKHNINWCEWVVKLGHSQLVSFFKGFWLSDGHCGSKGEIKITQNKGNIAEAIKLCGNLLGKVVTYNHKTDNCIVMSFRDNNFITGQKLKEASRRITDVFCITVPNSNFVIKQKGYITITGNCMYGAQAPKIAAMLGVSKETGQAVINAFWDTNLGLKKFKEALEAYWEATGKKYIRGIDGRKIYTRSRHSLVNAGFQSCGAILMSIAGCFMYDLLIKHGVPRNLAIRLAFVHDEYQYQVHKSLVTEYIFDTEEECVAFEREDGKLLSNPKKRGDKWYRYYSIVGELGNKSLNMAGKFLNMPVKFEAAYDVGFNLAETH